MAESKTDQSDTRYERYCITYGMGAGAAIGAATGGVWPMVALGLLIFAWSFYKIRRVYG